GTPGCQSQEAAPETAEGRLRSQGGGSRGNQGFPRARAPLQARSGYRALGSRRSAAGGRLCWPGGSHSARRDARAKRRLLKRRKDAFVVKEGAHGGTRGFPVTGHLSKRGQGIAPLGRAA